MPTFSYSPGNISAGGVLAHGNLFGRGKRGLIGGRISNVDSGVIVAYDDPAFFGSWGFFTIKGSYQSQKIPEYSNINIEDMPLAPIRITRLRSYGFEISVGIAWFRKVRTSFGWNLDWNEVRWSALEKPTPTPATPPTPTPRPRFPTAPAGRASARRGNVTANLTFDFRARQHAIMYGNALGFTFEYAAPFWGSDSTLWYWKASASYEHGIRFFKRHNLIVRVGGIAGENLPLWSENSAGGTNLRGYLYRQFQGDTHLRSQVEYHFPLFSLWRPRRARPRVLRRRGHLVPAAARASIRPSLAPTSSAATAASSCPRSTCARASPPSKTSTPRPASACASTCAAWRSRWSASTSATASAPGTCA